MSLEKSASVLDTLERIVNNKREIMRNAITAAAPVHDFVGKQSMRGLAPQILTTLHNNGAIGAGKLANGWKSIHSNLSKVDTGIGALLRGSASPKSVRYKLFTDNSAMIPMGVDKATGNNMFVNIPRASASKPIKALGVMAAGWLAKRKLSELINEYKQHRQNNSKYSEGDTYR